MLIVKKEIFFLKIKIKVMSSIINEEKNLNLNITNHFAFPKVRRVDTSSHERVYVEEQDCEKYFIGVSEFTRSFETSDDKEYLLSWREKMIEDFGKHYTESYVNLTAEYGTAFTTLICEYAIGKIKDNYDAEDLIAALIGEIKIPLDKKAIMAHNMMCDFTSIYLWAKEWQVKWHACEGFVRDEVLGYGTPIDFVVEAKDPALKGGHRFYWINLKSGRNQGAEMHENQQMWEWNAIRQTFPKEKEIIVGILSPKKITKTKGLQAAKFEVQKFDANKIAQIDKMRELAILKNSRSKAQITKVTFGRAFGEYNVEILKNK